MTEDGIRSYEKTWEDMGRQVKIWEGIGRQVNTWEDMG